MARSQQARARCAGGQSDDWETAMRLLVFLRLMLGGRRACLIQARQERGAPRTNYTSFLPFQHLRSAKNKQKQRVQRHFLPSLPAPHGAAGSGEDYPWQRPSPSAHRPSAHTGSWREIRRDGMVDFGLCSLLLLLPIRLRDNTPSDSHPPTHQSRYNIQSLLSRTSVSLENPSFLRSVQMPSQRLTFRRRQP